jgi:hypothetical protein
MTRFKQDWQNSFNKTQTLTTYTKHLIWSVHLSAMLIIVNTVRVCLKFLRIESGIFNLNTMDKYEFNN